MTSPKYMGGRVCEGHGYRFGIERLEHMQEEIELLHVAHWEETETKFLPDQLDPDYDSAIASEKRSRFVTFTVRLETDGSMVGNAMFFLGPCLHMKDRWIATEDTFYLLPKHRGKAVASGFLNFIQSSLADMDISYITMTDKSPIGAPSLKSLFARHGIFPVAISYIGRL